MGYSGRHSLSPDCHLLAKCTSSCKMEIGIGEMMGRALSEVTRKALYHSSFHSIRYG